MKFKEIERRVRGVPFISPERARDLYDIVIKLGAKRALELGFAHGASASYIAGALQENGGGKLDCVDLEDMHWQDPCIERTIANCGLSKYVEIYRERTSYTWFLKKKIDEKTKDNICEAEYDFIFIDGPKNWTIDGAAFFFSEKLLKSGGAIVFDDYNYAYGSSDKVTDGINHRILGEDELREPHVKLIFDLLVRPHPAFSKFTIINQQFAVAYKVNSQIKSVRVIERIGIYSKFMRLLRRLRRMRLQSS